MHIITYNVGNVGEPGATPENVAAVAGGFDGPWAIILQEVSGVSYMRKVSQLLSDRTSTPYNFVYSSKLRIGIISFGDIVDESIYHQQFRGSTNGAYLATFDIFDIRILFAGIHLAAIPKPRDTDGYVELTFGQLVRILGREFFQRTSRADAAGELVNVIREAGALGSVDGIIVAGDFNTIPASKTIRTMRKHFTDALDGTPGSRKGTYWKLRFPFRPRVDFIFLSDTIHTVYGDVITDRSADHLPVYAEIRLPVQSKTAE